MSEEEKKAIEYLKQNDIAEIQYDNYGLESIHRIGIDEKYIILNLIEKQQKEIENLKEINKEHQKLNGELREEIDDLKQLMAHKNGYTKQLEEDLFENASNYVVSKDKIREKIKELEDNMILFTNDKEKFNRYKYARNILEKLLEEE